MFIPRKGVKVKLYGNTPDTNQYKDCGVGAISDLLPLSLQISTTVGFTDIVSSLKYLGYVSGLTLQAIPYNFYLSHKNNEVSKMFTAHLKRLNKLTGKKTTVIAHSMGNLNALYNLDRMKPEMRSKLVFNYMSIAPPFLGATKVPKLLLSGNDDFITLGGYFGFHFSASVKTISNQASVFELFAKDFYRLYEEEPWFEHVKKRIEYEKKFPNIPYYNSGIDFWPRKGATCYDNTLSDFRELCEINLLDTKNFDIITIGEERFKLRDMEALYNERPLTYNTVPLFRKVVKDDIAYMNPGVPVVLLFMSTHKTPIAYVFDENFNHYIENNQYPPTVDIIYGNGDETVPTYSAVIPGLRWAYQFENEPDSGRYFPVKFVELCSKMNRHNTIYDREYSSREKEILENSYIGIDCECTKQEHVTSYDKCTHSNMLSDKYLIKTPERNRVRRNRGAQSRTWSRRASLWPFAAWVSSHS